MNLVYGLFIEQLNRDDFEIISYKDPAFIKPVNYKEILETLFNKISDRPSYLMIELLKRKAKEIIVKIEEEQNFAGLSTL